MKIVDTVLKQLKFGESGKRYAWSVRTANTAIAGSLRRKIQHELNGQLHTKKVEPIKTLVARQNNQVKIVVISA